MSIAEYISFMRDHADTIFLEEYGNRTFNITTRNGVISNVSGADLNYIGVGAGWALRGFHLDGFAPPLASFYWNAKDAYFKGIFKFSPSGWYREARQTFTSQRWTRMGFSHAMRNQ